MYICTQLERCFNILKFNFWVTCDIYTSVPEDGPQLPAQASLHQHVDVLPVLERLVQPEQTEIEQGFMQYAIFFT